MRGAALLSTLLVAGLLLLATVVVSDRGPAVGGAGDRLVFTGLHGQSRDLFVQSLEGTPVALTDDEFLDGDAVFSRDGDLIAFASDRAGSLDIWVMKADGTEPRQLTTNPAIDVGPSWAPDGQRIAFVSDREGDLGSGLVSGEP